MQSKVMSMQMEEAIIRLKKKQTYKKDSINFKNSQIKKKHFPTSRQVKNTHKEVEVILSEYTTLNSLDS